jgi:SEC-C motif-containing protein
LPATAEQLMRSRYSAYSRGVIDYLLRTHPSELPEAKRRQELKASCRGVRWTRLAIVATNAGGASDLTGTVTFEAHYRSMGQVGVLRECSRFGREGEQGDGRWLYLEAEMLEE